MLNSGSFRSVSLLSTNKSSWAGLSVDERKAFLKVAARTVIRTTASYAEGDEDGYKVAKAKNIPIVEPDAELLKRRNDFVENDLKVTIAHAKEKLKIADAEEFVANYKKLYEKYAKAIEPMGKDEKQLSDLLYKEVYAKIDVTKYGK